MREDKPHCHAPQTFLHRTGLIHHSDRGVQYASPNIVNASPAMISPSA
jgi:hypothetical protein